jgi:hypothetical protein
MQLKMASNHSVNAYPTTFFGPTVPGTFDFTPLFEDTLLSIVPSALLLLALPVRLFFLRDQPRKVLRSSLHSQKLACFPELLHFRRVANSEAVVSHRVCLDADGSPHSARLGPVTQDSGYYCSICTHSARWNWVMSALSFRAYPIRQTLSDHQCVSTAHASI